MDKEHLEVADMAHFCKVMAQDTPVKQELRNIKSFQTIAVFVNNKLPKNKVFLIDKDGAVVRVYNL